MPKRNRKQAQKKPLTLKEEFPRETKYDTLCSADEVDGADLGKITKLFKDTAFHFKLPVNELRYSEEWVDREILTREIQHVREETDEEWESRLDEIRACRAAHARQEKKRREQNDRLRTLYEQRREIEEEIKKEESW